MHEVNIHRRYFKLQQFVREKCRHKEIPQSSLHIPLRQTAPGAVNSRYWVKELQQGALVKLQYEVHRLLGYRLLHMLWSDGTKTGPLVLFGGKGCGKY
jgi:hypothetical protein